MEWGYSQRNPMMNCISKKGSNIVNKQAAIYARVSTDDQAERGYSLPSQIEACQRFASQKGFDIAAVYQDDISGAKPIASRPEGGELQNAIDTRQINTVIIFQVDRLSRDIVDLLATVRDWLRAGIEIYALDVGQITSELDIVLVIKGWQGGDERQKIRERTMRGRMTKAKSGRVVGQGFAPFGYEYSNGALVINELEAQTIRMIFDWYVNTGLSCRKIADRLTDLAIPRPGESTSWKRTRGKSRTWVHIAVQRIIGSETYAGVWRYGKTVRGSGKRDKRPIDEQISIDVPAIVSRELWNLAQERRAYNSKLAKRKMKREYLLRGLLFCGCGRHMVGTNGLYYCTRRYYTNGGERCTEPFVKGYAVESITWGYILRLLTNAEEFEQALRDAQAIEAEQMQPKQKELEHVIALLTDTEYEAEQIAATAKKVKGIVGEKLQVQADEIDRRYQVLSARKARLGEELKSELTDSTIDDLLQFRETVTVGLNNPTPEERRLWLELLQTKVIVTDGIVNVTCRLSREAVSFDLFTGYQLSRWTY
jgi:site-specific DNA recombinase